jgi:hypothetical protein
MPLGINIEQLQKLFQNDPLCRCPDHETPHPRCLVHRSMALGKKISPAYQSSLVADRLLGSPLSYCQVCNNPIRRHSTGSYFHLAPG